MNEITAGILSVLVILVFMYVFCYGVVISMAHMEGKVHGFNGIDYRNTYSAPLLPWAYDKGFTSGTRILEQYNNPKNDPVKRNKIKYGRGDSK